MAKYVVKQDREQCIGCGACVGLCPKFWEMNDDGKADLIGGKNNEIEIEDADLDCNKQAAENCPVNIIHITKEDGKK